MALNLGPFYNRYVRYTKIKGPLVGFLYNKVPTIDLEFRVYFKG